MASKKGFTLIEVLIVIAIISGIVTMISLFSFNITQFQFFIGKSLDVEGETQGAFKIINPELRSIGPSSTGSYPIASAASSSFSFYSDIDNDGIFEQVRYFLDGTTIKKGTIKPGGAPLVYNQANEKITEVVHNVTSSNIFYYYDKNYDGTNGSPLGYPMNLSAIRVVKMVLTVDDNPNAQPGPLIVSAIMNIRNLRGL